MFAAKLKLTSPQGKTHDSKKKAFQGGSRSCRAACSGLPRPPRDIKKWIEENEKKGTIIGSEANFFCVVFCAFAVCSSGVVVVAAGLVFELCCACLWGGLSNDY